MGLTVSHKTAKNLAVRRKNERILNASRYQIDGFSITFTANGEPEEVT